MTMWIDPAIADALETANKLRQRLSEVEAERDTLRYLHEGDIRQIASLKADQERMRDALEVVKALVAFSAEERKDGTDALWTEEWLAINEDAEAVLAALSTPRQEPT